MMKRSTHVRVQYLTQRIKWHPSSMCMHAHFCEQKSTNVLWNHYRLSIFVNFTTFNKLCGFWGAKGSFNLFQQINLEQCRQLNENTLVCLKILLQALPEGQALRSAHTQCNGACAHDVMVSKFQWKPFWLATHRDPQNDWAATQNHVNYDVFAQAPFWINECDHS